MVNQTKDRYASAADALSALPSPARYHPYASGRYEIRTGLHRLGTAFGNGAADSQIFQLDRAWPEYRAAKLASRAEEPAKYICSDRLPAALEARLSDWMIAHLPAEHPGVFDVEKTVHGMAALHNGLSGERLVFSSGHRLVETHAPHGLEPPYTSSLDALACQLQEDIALTSVDADGGNRLCYLHLCLPNHWSPGEKIGQPFDAVHAPVPHMERIHRRIGRVLQALVDGGPYVRFAWGVATDRRLNHHPVAPAGFDELAWAGRHFDPRAPELYVRVERQVTVGFPEHHAFLFTIRTYLEDVAALSREHLAQLRAAIEGMDPAARRYKGLEHSRAAMLDWLSELWRR